MASVLVAFGGRSSERAISCLSAAFVVETLRRANEHEVWTVGVTEDGRWLLTDASPEAIAEGAWQRDARLVSLHPGAGRKAVSVDGRSLVIDVAFPLFHGRYGEDGTVQGLFELLGLPYVGCGVVASAVAMDKGMSRHLFDALGLPQVPWLEARRYDDRDALKTRVMAALGYPCFVKPANAGSSIGITKVKRASDLSAALDTAFRYDDKILVEAACTGREVELAVLGNGNELFVSVPGEIRPCHDFYDYEAKYIDPHSTLIVPAQVSEAERETLTTLARRAYMGVGCSGMSRVDFYVSPDGVRLNEINTIPGFTSISMYKRVMEASGVDNVMLLNRLVTLAQETFDAKQALA